jgi:hypothetical protein
MVGCLGPSRPAQDAYVVVCTVAAVALAAWRSPPWAATC